MDSRTFGDSPAAVVLADKVSNDKKLRRKVTNILKEYHEELNAITGVEGRFRISVTYMIFEKYRAKCASLPLPISSYTENVLSSKHKALILRLKTSLNKK